MAFLEILGVLGILLIVIPFLVYLYGYIFAKAFIKALKDAQQEQFINNKKNK